MPNIQSFMGACCNIPYLKADKYQQAVFDERTAKNIQLDLTQSTQRRQEVVLTVPATIVNTLRAVTTQVFQPVQNFLQNVLVQPLQNLARNMQQLIQRPLVPLAQLPRTMENLASQIFSFFFAQREQSRSDNAVREKREQLDLKLLQDAQLFESPIDSKNNAGFGQSKQ
jgi:hypothetical protein